MVLIQLTGKITENGKLEVDLPEGLPPGDVQITIEMPAGEEIIAELDADLSDSSWTDIKISGAEWVQEQRRKNERKFPKW